MSKKGNQKFVIKPFRANVHMDASTADKIWTALQLAIGEIHNKNPSTLSFEELYRQAYSLVLHKHGEKLYDGVYSTVRKHLLAVAGDVSTAPDETLLVALSRRWNDPVATHGTEGWGGDPGLAVPTTQRGLRRLAGMQYDLILHCTNVDETLHVF